MKYCWLAGWIVFIHFNGLSQVLKTKGSLVTIIKQRSIALNGGTRAAFGGKSRIIIPVVLPEGTKSWFYSFSTTPGESGTQNLNLLGQLSSFVSGGLTQSVLSKITVPNGTSSLDIYLLDQANATLFTEKAEYSYYQEGSVENTKQAWVEVEKYNKGSYFLGLKNPSSLNGLNVEIEVVAAIETKIEQKDQDQAINCGNLGWKAFERGDYQKCIELSNKALKLDNSLGYVHFNLGLCYLMKGQVKTASNIYTKAISVAKKSVVPKETLEGALTDLKTYLSKIPAKPAAQDLLDLLELEVKNYR